MPPGLWIDAEKRLSDPARNDGEVGARQHRVLRTRDGYRRWLVTAVAEARKPP